MKISHSCFDRALKNGGNIQEFMDKYGSSEIYKYLLEHSDLTKQYFETIAKRLTQRRDTVNMSAVLRESLENHNQQKAMSHTKIKYILREVALNEYERQKNIFINSNSSEMDINNDIWKIFWFNGPRMNCIVYDFKIIECSSLRKEVKYFMRYYLQISKSNRLGILYNASKILNYITKNNPNIKYFSDIAEVDVRTAAIYLETSCISKYDKKLSLVTIGKSIYSCAQIMDFLMGQLRSNEIRSPKPTSNYFRKIKIYNINKFNKNTLILPENIIAELDMFCNELSEMHKAMYKIFLNTGLRFKEVAFLKDNCLQKSKFNELYELKYTPYKTLSARRRKMLPDENSVLIPAVVSDIIKQQLKNSMLIRKKYELPYIFAGENRGNKVSMVSDYGFRNALNKIIKKHDIHDENGELWKFSVKQFRKTIAVALIESGASIHELAYHLGHYRYGTSMKYYADVRKEKLAEMNTQFFKEKFDLIVHSQQLESYTDEQRKILYVDFCLGQRRVESGFCSRPFSITACNERNRLFNCVNCKNLCTGKKYLSYWEEIRNAQMLLVQRLIEFYKQNNISEYEDFKEYRQELFLLNSYTNTIDKILNFEGGAHYEK